MAFPYLSPKGQRRAGIVAVIAVVFFAGTQYTGKVDESRFAEATYDALVGSCQKNGNPLRESVRDILQSQNDQAERNLRTGVIAQLADTHQEFVRFRHLSKVAIWKRNQQLKDLAPVSCPDQFPKP